MEMKRKPTMASASRALRAGGRALSEITGAPEPAMEQRNVLRDGFRRLTGAPAPPARRRGE